MGKFAPDVTLDKELDYIALADYLVACSGSPLTYDAAYSGSQMLAKVALTGADFTKAPDINGRKVTVAAKSAVSITTSGNAETVGLVNTGSGVILITTTCTGQMLTAGGTVDFPSFKINVQNPT